MGGESYNPGHWFPKLVHLLLPPSPEKTHREDPFKTLTLQISGFVPDRSQLWLGSLWAVPEACPGPSSNYLSIQICIFFLITIFCNFTPPATNSPTTGSVPDRSQVWLGSLWPVPEVFPGPSSNYFSIPIYLDNQKGFHIPYIFLTYP